MKKVISLFALVAALVVAVSCNNDAIKKMQSAANVTTSCTPEILEAREGQVPVTISIGFPKNYFHPEALMVVTPVIVYEGGEMTGEPKIYQGEGIKDNYITVAKAGATVKQSYAFPYNEGMRKCYLEIRPVLISGDKKVNMQPIKVAEGCRTLLQDARKTSLRGDWSEKPDGYEYVVRQKTEGRILYDVNSSNVKKSELRSASIKEMQEELNAIKNDGKSRIVSTEIVTYASPEGGQEYNAKLSDRRAETAAAAWKGINEGVEAAAKKSSVTSVGQDWEGFAEAVRNSNIIDKDLILRVLSMYSDPAVREKEIRNLSQLYTELKTEVFPELRRARFVTNSEYENYTDAELQKLAEYRLFAMDEPSLLKLASLSDTPEKKMMLYRLAIEKYGSQTAVYNLAKLEMDNGNFTGANDYLKLVKNQKDPDILNALGVCAMNKGAYDDAEEFFIRAANNDAQANLGTLELVKGNYAGAAEKLQGTGSRNEAIALIMAGQYDKAAAAISGEDAQSDYIRAIVAARQGKSGDVSKWLDSAVQKDPSLKEKSEKDIEFTKYR